MKKNPRKANSATYLAAERAALLDRTLKHAAFDGWTARALKAAAADLGYTADLVTRAFPRGIDDVLVYFNHDLDRRMLAALEAAGVERLRIRERIALAVRTRLELSQAHREAAGRAISYYAVPRHAPAGARAIARTVDLMWRAAGDTATDFNFYSKRALLAAVYGSTTAYWVADTSDGAAATWRFLDRRIADVMNIQKWRGRATDALRSLGGSLGRQFAATFREQRFRRPGRAP